MFNSVYVKVRLHYKRPTDGEWSFHDGLGAVGVQTDKGASASDLNAIKQDAIMKALPAAESYAIKDAAEKLGVLFGKDLNRKETMPYEASIKEITQKELYELLEYKAEKLTAEEYKHASDILSNNQTKDFQRLNKLLNSK